MFFHKLIKFVVCASGIYFCYITIGILQEKIYKTNHGTEENPSPDFDYAFILILLQMLGLWWFSYIMLKYKNIEYKCTFTEGMYMGLMNFSSIFSALTALKFISFPLQAIAKSCKILSVLVVGILFGKVSFTKTQIISGIVITVGIVVYQQNEQVKKNQETSYFGLVALFVSLFSDGLLATLQSQYKKEKKIEQWEMSYHIARGGVICSFFFGILQFSSFYHYVTSFPDIIFPILQYSLLGIAGQFFIFYCIKVFSPHTLAVVTTSRKFFTILTSIFWWGHHIIPLQWVAIIAVAGALSAELIAGIIEYQQKHHHQKQNHNNHHNHDIQKNQKNSQENSDFKQKQKQKSIQNKKSKTKKYQQSKFKQN